MEKLDPQINKPQRLELLYDNPLVGENKFGSYYCYKVRTEKGEELSFFAPEEVHNQLKDKRKGEKFELTKVAKQKGKKLIQEFDIRFLNGEEEKNKETEPPEENGYYDAMLKSYEEATKIQNKFSAVNLNQCAVTLFIARTKTNGFMNYPKE